MYNLLYLLIYIFKLNGGEQEVPDPYCAEYVDGGWMISFWCFSLCHLPAGELMLIS